LRILLKRALRKDCFAIRGLEQIRAATLHLRVLEVPKPVGGTFRNREMVQGILTDPAYAGKPYCFTLP
jgi:hypothetical protein